MNNRLMWCGIPLVLVLCGCSAFQTGNGPAEKSWQRVTLATDEQLEPAKDNYIGMERIGVVTLTPSSDRPSVHIDEAKRLIYTSAEYELARQELGKVFYQKPNHAQAMAFYTLISADIETLAIARGFDLKADKVVYITKSGDDLRQIAQRFYGDTDDLVFLMRINKLSGLSLKGGEHLWIPSKAASSKRKAVKKTAPAKVAQKATVKKAKKAINTPKAAKQPEAQAFKVVNDSKSSNMVGDSAVLSEKDAPKALETDKPSTPTVSVNAEPPVNQESAQSAAEPPPSFDALGTFSSPQKAPPKRIIVKESSELKEELKGLSEYRKGSPKEAYSLLVSAADLSEEGQLALDSLRQELIEQPYARGLMLYQEQKLERAVQEFDRVLSVDPTYLQASVYRARCLQLLERLQTIQ